MQHTSPLSELVRPEQYRSERDNVFSSDQSLTWYTRKNKKRLEEAGALLHIAGRLWINPKLFDSCVLEAGARPPREAA